MQAHSSQRAWILAVFCMFTWYTRATFFDWCAIFHDLSQSKAKKHAYTHFKSLLFRLCSIIVIFTFLVLFVTILLLLHNQKVYHQILGLYSLCNNNIVLLQLCEGDTWFWNTARDVEQDCVVIKVKYFRVERCRYLGQNLGFQSGYCPVGWYELWLCILIWVSSFWLMGICWEYK